MRTMPTALAALTAAATLGVAAAPAFAADTPATTPTTPGSLPGDAAAPPSLSAIQAKAASAVSVRVDALQKAAQRVQAATWLGADQATLLGTLQGDVPKLQALGQKISADTDVTTARADYEAIFSQYRVFWLVLPSTRLVSSADRISADTAPKATAAIEKLQSHETTADQAQVAPLLTDAQGKVSAATSAVSGLSAKVLAITPAAFDTDRTALQGPKTAVHGAVTDLTAARGDLRQARSDERASRAAGRPGRAGTAGGTAPSGGPAGSPGMAH